MLPKLSHNRQNWCHKSHKNFHFDTDSWIYETNETGTHKAALFITSVWTVDFMLTVKHDCLCTQGFDCVELGPVTFHMFSLITDKALLPSANNKNKSVFSLVWKT